MILKVLLYLTALTLIDGTCRYCSSFNQLDCQKVYPLCKWDSNQCQTFTLNSPANNFTLTMEYSNYCTSFNSTYCNLKYGCAFYGGKCSMFLGCDAYTGYSNEQCFNVSYICTYTSGNNCSRNLNYDTNGQPNVTLSCIDAPYYYQSKDKCKLYDSTCAYNGLNCVDELEDCDQQSFNTSTLCNKLIGQDGKCTQNTATRCKLQQCSSQSEDDCKSRNDCYFFNNTCIDRKVCQDVAYSTNCSFTDDCYFDGVQCTKTLKSCSEYHIDTCDGKYGINGLCMWDNQCRTQQCYQNKIYTQIIQDFYCQTLNLCIDNHCSTFNKIDCLSNDSDCYFDSSSFKCMRRIDPCESYSLDNCGKNNNNCSSLSKLINKQECLDALSESECKYNIQQDSTIPCYWDDDMQICQQATQCEQLIGVNDVICKRLSSNCYYNTTANSCLDARWLQCNQRIEKYCKMSNDCYWTQRSCVPAYFNCEDIKSQNDCYVNIYQFPCKWNSTLSICLRYHERDPYISQYLCESLSTKWEFNNNTCKLKQRCYELNYTGQGFEGDCETVYEEQISNCTAFTNKKKCQNNTYTDLSCFWNNTQCNSISSCSVLLDADFCNQQTFKCKYDYTSKICKPIKCSDLSPSDCQPIKGFTLDSYMYCKLVGGKCFQVPPENDADCFLYTQGKSSFEEESCAPCTDEGINYFPRQLVKNYTMLDLDNLSVGEILTSMIFIIIINL